mmetsp:Transcript_56943/g.123248  ORF Transcript_56943/g.123248 Transcript_56943/m.123248 type:complete len:267 (+) Transcript_56943:171-971(+)
MMSRSLGRLGMEKVALGIWALGPRSAFVMQSFVLALVSRVSAAKWIAGSDLFLSRTCFPKQLRAASSSDTVESSFLLLGNLDAWGKACTAWLRRRVSNCGPMAESLPEYLPGPTSSGRPETDCQSGLIFVFSPKRTAFAPRGLVRLMLGPYSPPTAAGPGESFPKNAAEWFWSSAASFRDPRGSVPTLIWGSLLYLKGCESTCPKYAGRSSSSAYVSAFSRRCSSGRLPLPKPIDAFFKVECTPAPTPAIVVSLPSFWVLMWSCEM